MPNPKRITPVTHKQILNKVDDLMKKGEKNLTNKEIAELKRLSRAAYDYENSIYTIPAPKTLAGLIELKMFERKLKQKELARFLKVSEPKLSQIMTLKRKPDVSFLKTLHKKLGIDGNLLLEIS